MKKRSQIRCRLIIRSMTARRILRTCSVEDRSRNRMYYYAVYCCLKDVQSLERAGVYHG